MLFQSGLGIYIRESGLSIVYLKSSLKTVRVEKQADYLLDPKKPLKDRMLICPDLIADFIKSNNVSSSDIFIGIPRESVILRDIELPLAVKENLRSTLEYKIENYVPLKVENIYFDYQILEEDKQLNQLKILLIVVQKDILETYLRLKDRLGIGLTGISISSAAFVNYLSYHPDTSQDANYVFIHESDLESGKKLHLGVVVNKLLQYSRCVSFSGENDSESVLEKELKPVKELLDGMAKPVKLFFMANGKKSPVLPYLRADNQFQVHTPNPASAGISSSAMITAMGLALRGVKKVPMPINLLPAHLRKRPSRTAMYIMLALIGLFAASGLMWGGSKIMRQSLILNNLETETERLMAEVKNIDNIREDIQNLETRVEYLERLLRGNVPLIEVLNEVTDRIPETAWIQDFNYNDKGVQIYGFADSASELISLLETSPIISDVVFLSTITRGQDGKERFRIGFKINS
ncbi:MAG: pilus assembly protein PilM [Desulfobacterales bacterium]